MHAVAGAQTPRAVRWDYCVHAQVLLAPVSCVSMLLQVLKHLEKCGWIIKCICPGIAGACCLHAYMRRWYGTCPSRAPLGQ